MTVVYVNTELATATCAWFVMQTYYETRLPLAALQLLTAMSGTLL